MQLRDIVVNLLHNLGSKKEVSKYLQTFTRDASHHRVVIKVGGGILAEQLEELTASIAFLCHVGMRPIIVHGAGPQLSRELDAKGIVSEWVDGQRVTTPEILASARKVFQQEGHRLADALDRSAVRARPFSSGVFSTRNTKDSALGFVGEVTGVDTDLIESTLANDVIPIISPLGETENGQILNLNADIAARELSLAVQARKVVFLTPTGGLLDPRGEIIPAINLVEDYDRLTSADWVHGGMALKLREIRFLLERLPADASISITSPEHIASELFTHQGQGTLIRRGVRVRLHTGTDGLDTARLTRVISESFGRPLREQYFNSSQHHKRILVAGDYEAVAIITHDAPVPYLDKFAVTSEAQGVGLAASLWHNIQQETNQLCWRSRPNNDINPWYIQRADGMIRTTQWIVFWFGLKDHNQIQKAVDHALARPHTLGPILPSKREASVAH
jgi:acetylglutamate kinase